MAHVQQALAGSDVDFFPPQATYLTWWGFDSYASATKTCPASVLLEQAGVAVNDGATLGAGYENWIRVNLACSREVCADLCQRITVTLGVK